MIFGNNITYPLFLESVIVVVFLLPAITFGAFDGMVDWSASGGVAVSAVSEGSNSFRGNPSGILHVEEWGASASWHREWELDELSSGNVSGILSRSWGSIAIGGSFVGDAALYTESIVGAAYARRIGKLEAGIRANFGMARTDNWNANTILIGVGAMYPTSKVASVGFWVDNITASKIDGNVIPMRSAIGVKYYPTNWINLHADYYLEGDQKATMRFGQETIIAELVSIRGGVNFRPNTYHFGLGVLYNDFELSWSYIAHPELGGSMMVGLEYER